jgi:hypothetical protein
MVEIMLCFSEIPKIVFAGSIEAILFLAVPFLFLLFPSAIP